jgi:hypothetical protein
MQAKNRDPGPATKRSPLSDGSTHPLEGAGEEMSEQEAEDNRDRDPPA